jgi:Kef-type K+ transport system membrane component KefB
LWWQDYSVCYVLPYLGKQLERIGFSNRTGFFTLMLIIAVGYAELAGLHHILGAFLAGLFLRDSVFNRRLSKELNKVFYDVSIGFLAPIFFVTAGYQVTFEVFEVFQTNLLLLMVILAVATFGKILGTTLFYLPSGFGWREGLRVGTGMNGRGAVEIIIAGIGLKMGFINQEIFSILVFMAIFTTATVPVLLTWTTKWLRSRGELVLADSEKQGILIFEPIKYSHRQTFASPGRDNDD